MVSRIKGLFLAAVWVAIVGGGMVAVKCWSKSTFVLRCGNGGVFSAGDNAKLTLVTFDSGKVLVKVHLRVTA